MVNFFRAPGLLFADQQAGIKSLEEDNERLSSDRDAVIAVLKTENITLMKRLVEDGYDDVKSCLDGEPDDVVAVFRDLLNREKRRSHLLPHPQPVANRRAVEIGEKAGIIQTYKDDRRQQVCRINPYFTNGLRRYLRQHQRAHGGA